MHKADIPGVRRWDDEPRVVMDERDVWLEGGDGRGSVDAREGDAVLRLVAAVGESVDRRTLPLGTETARGYRERSELSEA